MEAKKWYLSKLVWLGVLEIAVGIAQYIAALPAGASVATVVAGCLTIIFRIVTNQPIRK